MEQSLDALKKQGADIVDPADIATAPSPEKMKMDSPAVRTQSRLERLPRAPRPNAPVHTLPEVIAFNEKNHEKEMPYFGQDMFIKAEAKGPLTSKEYLDALNNNLRLARQQGIDATMDQFKLDTFVAPTGGPASLTDLVAGDNTAAKAPLPQP